MFLTGIKIEEPVNEHVYPFQLAMIQHIKNVGLLSFERPVTFLAGENGAGKSTLLEAIAVAYGMNAEGGTKNFQFATRPSHSNLYQSLRLIRKGKIPEDTFFLRAETYYNIATEIDDLGLAGYYETDSLHHFSHGEGMLSIVMNHFRGNGFYILDEPESGLSVTHQLTLLRELTILAQQENCQLIIATHSPVLLALPDAAILHISEQGIQQISYEETQAYTDMKAFIDDPERMLHYLL
ncbi:hypothetical protein A5886_002684 [Enterococcus sp. 8G7_MSG3316]|uniref:AAA+ ATPase domain-containing protein n=1 Tax=Candidatus Enterococcus testudinis TaxID=1834191 RepID=A0A242A981_9ENTE|nr:AAA family ATPase [Enterococcus sp. 8G7_MSG3316]OTN77584.1 hypothetical protein A5886_002684 [Enterococcus sp. 8G7_MSG3316]